MDCPRGLQDPRPFSLSRRGLDILSGRFKSGFTLVELIVAMAVLSMMGIFMLSVVGTAQNVAKQTTSRTEQYREARRAFERINQRLSKATLNTYWDYVDASGNPRTTATAANFTPSKYFRVIELRYLQTNATSLFDTRG